MPFDLTSLTRYIAVQFLALAETPISDLAISAGDSTKVSSAGNPFTGASVGGLLNILDGVGFTLVSRTVLSVTSGVATLDGSAGTVGSTAGRAVLETTLQDLSADLIIADTAHTDEVKAHTASFVFFNGAGRYDKLAGSQALTENRLITYRKGYASSKGGTITWYPQFKGRVTRANPSYVRYRPDGTAMNQAGEVIQINAFDLFKNGLRQKVTTDLYVNWQTNKIAVDILARYFGLTNTSLYALDRIIALFQAPDLSLIDILSTLYDIPLYFVWSNYAGVIETFPRLGSGGGLTGVAAVGGGGTYSAQARALVVGGGGVGAQVSLTISGGVIVLATVDDPGEGYTTEPSIVVEDSTGSGATFTTTIGGSGLVGYPDSTSAPAATPDFIFADATLISSINDSWQDFDFQNQIRVLGRSLEEKSSTGAYQVLATLGDPNNLNFEKPGGGNIFRLEFSGTNNGQNILTAKNIYVKWHGPDFNNDPVTSRGGPGYAYMVFGPSADFPDPPISQDTQQPIPFGPYENGSSAPVPSIFIGKSGHGGKQEGGASIVSQSPQAIHIGEGANSDGGGFEFWLEVWGQPIVVSQQTLTVILDYNPTYVSAPTNLKDVFGDHQTYQFPQFVLAMGTPVEMQVNPSSLLACVLTAPVAVGDTVIHVSNTTHLSTGQSAQGFPLGQLRLGSQAIGNAEYPVADKFTTNTITLSQPAESVHPVGEAVIGLSGVVSADGVLASDVFQVDFERGRAVFTSRVYKCYAADELFSGNGIASSTHGAPVALNFVQPAGAAAPEALYQSFREVANQGTSFTYTLAGLSQGVGYTVRLHLVEPAFAASGQRVFNVYANGVQVVQDLDIFQQAGGHLRAAIFDIQGVAADDTGAITLQFGDSLKNVVSNQALVCGIEAFLSQGLQQIAYAINAGGGSIGPSPSSTLSGAVLAGAATVTVADASGFVVGAQAQVGDIGVGLNAEDITIGSIVGNVLHLQAGTTLQFNHGSGAAVYALPQVVSPGYAYSPVQQIYGINNIEIDDALLKTVDECKATGRYFLNQIAWSRNPLTFRCMSVPTIRPTGLLKLFHPRLGANGADVWVYVQGVTRHTERPAPDTTGGVLEGESDHDELTCFVLLVQLR